MTAALDKYISNLIQAFLKENTGKELQDSVPIITNISVEFNCNSYVASSYTPEGDYIEPVVVRGLLSTTISFDLYCSKLFYKQMVENEIPLSFNSGSFYMNFDVMSYNADDCRVRCSGFLAKGKETSDIYNILASTHSIKD